MGRKSWSAEDVQYLELNYGKTPINELADHFGVSYQAVIDKARKTGLNSKLISGEIWNQEDDHLLTLHFEWAPKNFLLKLFPTRTWPSIFQRGLKTLGLNRLTQDRYIVNYKFFDEWTQEAAYVFGFIAADGHIFQNRGKQNKNALQFEVAQRDIDILEKIKKVMDYEGPLCITNRETVKLAISNTKIISRLVKLGIPSRNKTFTVEWPQKLPAEHYSSFVRGLFDGDGSVWEDDGRIRVQFLGTKQLLDVLKTVLPFDTSSNTVCHRSYNGKGPDVYGLKFCKKKSIQLFEWMYNDATIFLDRKYQKFVAYIENINNEI